MKNLTITLLVFFLVPVLLLSCKKDNDDDDNQPEPKVYTINYSFDISKGNFENLVIQYADKDQQMQTLNSPQLPWSMELTNVSGGRSVKLIVNFTGKPSDELIYNGEAKYEGNGAFDIKNCGQTISGLTTDVPLSCNLETQTPSN